MIPSRMFLKTPRRAVYQRGWMIDSQLVVLDDNVVSSISKGMDD